MYIHSLLAHDNICSQSLINKSTMKGKNLSSSSISKSNMEIEEQFEIFEMLSFTPYYIKNNDNIAQPLKVEDICNIIIRVSAWHTKGPWISFLGAS